MAAAKDPSVGESVPTKQHDQSGDASVSKNLTTSRQSARLDLIAVYATPPGVVDVKDSGGGAVRWLVLHGRLQLVIAHLAGHGAGDQVVA
jgi:hypothetical protein